jgi:hypothetical protein
VCDIEKIEQCQNGTMSKMEQTNKKKVPKAKE